MTQAKTFDTHDIERNKLFFDQYEFSLTLYLPGANCVRGKSQEKVKSLVWWRNHHRRNQFHKLNTEHVENLLDFCQHLQDVDSNSKTVLFENHFSLYTNHVPDIDKLIALPYVTALYVQRARVTLPKDSIQLAHPKHRYRSYFRNCRISQDNFAMLQKFLLQREDVFRCSPSLKKVLTKNPYRYCFGNWFVDFNDQRDFLLLNMVSPGVVKPPLNIVAK
jgi:hypothetical protein